MCFLLICYMLSLSSSVCRMSRSTSSSLPRCRRPSEESTHSQCRYLSWNGQPPPFFLLFRSVSYLLLCHSSSDICTSAALCVHPTTLHLFCNLMSIGCSSHHFSIAFSHTLGPDCFLHVCTYTPFLLMNERGKHAHTDVHWQYVVFFVPALPSLTINLVFTFNRSNKRKVAAQVSDPMAGADLQNGLEAQVCVNTCKLWFRHDTEDYFARAPACIAARRAERCAASAERAATKFHEWCKQRASELFPR